MQEITAPLATLPDDPVPAVADVDFPIVLRGYDRLAVDAYVKQTSQLVAELQATRSPEAAVRRALERVGEEVSGILQRAHETAEQITATSRREAEDRLDVVRQEGAALTAAAERRVKDLDAETDRIWAERHRIVEDARLLAQQLLALADSASERFPAEEPPPPAGAAGDAEALTEDDEDEETTVLAVPFGDPEPGQDEAATEIAGEDEGPTETAGEALAPDEPVEGPDEPSGEAR